MRSHEEHWEGPLPSPRTMDEYRQIGPDWPDKIIAQWEAESLHRRSYETWALRATIARDILGQILAGAFALAALYVAHNAIVDGQPLAGVILGGGTIASVVGAFLYQRRGKQSPPSS